MTIYLYLRHLIRLKLYKDTPRIYSIYKTYRMDSVPTLNFDIISKILNIRMNDKKSDRYKNNFNSVVKNMNNIYSDVHSEGLSLSLGEPESKYFIGGVFELIYMDNQVVQRPYMPWEKEWS